LQANVGFSQLGDVAAASPIVGRRNATSVALGTAYEF
jgi:outer membrane scaffolding protein for murein synthesis (MipA/OmpV family)